MAESGSSRDNTDGGRYSLNLTPLTGMLIGQSEEILYKYKDRDQYASQLLWDMKPLYYAGLKLDFGPRETYEGGSFIFTGSVKFGLPLRTGIMEDRDWSDSTEDYLTHYSQHDLFCQNAILADLLIGYSYGNERSAAVSVFLEFSYMYFSWMAENGYYQYAKRVGGHYQEWDDSIEKVNVYGAAIRYIQDWLIPAAGFSLKTGMSRYFFLDWKISFSPFAYCADRDDHLLDQGQLFYGYFSYGNFYNLSLGLHYTPSKNLDLSLSVSYRYITELRDKTYYAKTGAGVSGTPFENYEGGVRFSALDINLAVRIRVYGR